MTLSNRTRDKLIGLSRSSAGSRSIFSISTFLSLFLPVISIAHVFKIHQIPDGYSAEFLRISAGVTYIGSNAKAN